MFEGTPDFPDYNRFWDVIERHKVSIFYTAPTAIRSFMKWGLSHIKKHDLSSLRLLGTVGEPINPDVWLWYHEHIGSGMSYCGYLVANRNGWHYGFDALQRIL